MGALKRGSRSQERYRAEHKTAITERRAKKEALAAACEAQAEAASLRESLAQEKGTNEVLQSKATQLEGLQGEVSRMEEELQIEKGVCQSLLSEIEKLKTDLSNQAVELVKATETLERVEQEAVITYDDCVQKFKESQAFIDELEEKAGVYHEEGYNDCLQFIGVGSMVDLAAHSIDKYREAELAKYEKKKAEAEDRARAKAEEEAKTEADDRDKAEVDERAEAEAEGDGKTSADADK